MENVYKYASIGAKGDPGVIEFLLEGQTLRFAPPASQNDPNEAISNSGALLSQTMAEVAMNQYPNRAKIHPALETIPSEDWGAYFYGDNILGNTNRASMILEAGRTAQKQFRQFGILSLTKSNNNTLMWSHYAKSASGLCIGFRSDAKIFGESKFEKFELSGIHEVKYSKERAGNSQPTLTLRIAEIVLTKSMDWAYEEELRCFREIPEGQSQLTPSFEAEDITEIIIGCNMPADQAQQCVELHKAKYSHAKLLLALPNPEVFEMIMVKCPTGKMLDFVLTGSSEPVRPILDSYSSDEILGK